MFAATVDTEPAGGLGVPNAIVGERDSRAPGGPEPALSRRRLAGPGGPFANLNSWEAALSREARGGSRPGTGPVCPRFHEAVELVGRRWTGAILFSLIERPAVLPRAARRGPGVSDRLLSQRLRELEAEGLVERSVHEGAPARVSYRLSESGGRSSPR